MDPTTINHKLEEMTRLVEEEQQAARSESCFNEAHDPLRSLPSELIAQIFQYGIEDCHPFLTRWRCRLSHVCQAWRQIVFTTPTLWTHVYFHLRHFSKDRKSSLLEFEEALRRSGTLPISVILKLNGVAMPVFFKQHLPRVHTLELLHTNEHHLMELSDVSSSTLRHIKIIDCLNTLDRSGFPTLIDLNGLTSRTEIVRLDSIRVKYLKLCWDHIVEVELSDIYVTTALRVLQEGASIRKCILALDYGVDCYDDIEEITTPVEHTQLQNLYVRMSRPYYGYTQSKIPLFLASVTFPSLQLLSISTYDNLYFRSFKQFLMRSACSLQRLYLPDFFEEKQDRTRVIQWILQVSPQIEVLDMGGKHFKRKRDGRLSDDDSHEDFDPGEEL